MRHVLKIVLVGAALCGGAAGASIAITGAVQRAVDSEPVFSALHLSATHLVIVEYELPHDTELARAQWRLRPFGTVVVEK